jgi:hypothetical protein
MNTSSKSVMAFGVYLIGMGAGLVTMPNVVLGTLGFPATDGLWSRVVGVLALAIAFYYIQAARADFRPFVQWTVYTRIAVFLSFTAFTVTGVAGPMMILLGSVDLAGALWTASALRKEKEGLGGALPKRVAAQ